MVHCCLNLVVNFPSFLPPHLPTHAPRPIVAEMMSTPDATAECPICGRTIPVVEQSAHVDECLSLGMINEERSRQPPAPPPQAPQAPAAPPRNYAAAAAAAAPGRGDPGANLRVGVRGRAFSRTELEGRMAQLRMTITRDEAVRPPNTAAAVADVPTGRALVDAEVARLTGPSGCPFTGRCKVRGDPFQLAAHYVQNHAKSKMKDRKCPVCRLSLGTNMRGPTGRVTLVRHLREEHGSVVDDPAAAKAAFVARMRGNARLEDQLRGQAVAAVTAEATRAHRTAQARLRHSRRLLATYEEAMTALEEAIATANARVAPPAAVPAVAGGGAPPPGQPPRSVTSVTNRDLGECVICFDDMESGSEVTRLECLCTFHRSCITEWFNTKASCPTHADDGIAMYLSNFGADGSGGGGGATSTT